MCFAHIHVPIFHRKNAVIIIIHLLFSWLTITARRCLPDHWMQRTKIGNKSAMQKVCSIILFASNPKKTNPFFQLSCFFMCIYNECQKLMTWKWLSLTINHQSPTVEPSAHSWLLLTSLRPEYKFKRWTMERVQKEF